MFHYKADLHSSGIKLENILWWEVKIIQIYSSDINNSIKKDK